MKHTFQILFLCLFVIFIPLSIKGQSSQDKLKYTFNKEAGSVNPNIIGIWKSIGNGYYLEAKKSKILLYSYTKNYIYKEKNDYLEGLLNSQSQFTLQGDTLSIYLTDYGQKTNVLQTKKDFVRVDAFPDTPLYRFEIEELDYLELFDLYIETHQENYAFAKERELDWNTISLEYKKLISSQVSQDSLFKVLGEVAKLTKDQHTKVINAEGKRLQYTVTPSALVVQEAFEEQSKIKDLNEYFNLFFETNRKNIADSILQGKGKWVANNQIQWGDVNANIGYMNISAFAGLTKGKYPRKTQIDSLNNYMQEMIQTFQDKEAIIIDISFNFGGYDAACLTVASYFTDKPVFAYTSQVFNNGKYYDEDEVIVYPAASVTFTKPVYILMTDISRSAAENFAMMMDVLPNVKLAGKNTLGILSGMLGKSIGDFYMTYSNQRLVNEDGKIL